MISAHSPAREICYKWAGCPGNLGSLTRALQRIQLALPRFVNLSNWGTREFDVNLEPDGDRKIFSKINLGANLRAWRRADVPIGDVAHLSGWRKHQGSSGASTFVNDERPD